MTNISKMLPACGFAIAAALVAVTSAFKEAPKTHNGQTLYRFSYVPPSAGDYSVSSVEKAENWSYAPGESCQTGIAEACTLDASASHVDVSDPSNPVLLSTENIAATLNTPTQTARVSSTADGVFANKSN